MLHIPRSGNTHTNSLASLATSSTQGLPRVILVENLCKPIEMKREMVHIHQIKMGPNWMDSIVLFLKEDILPEEKSKADKVQKKTSRFWLSEDQSCTSALFLGHTYYAYTLRHQSYSLRSYMKGFVEAIWEASLCLTKPLLKDTGGRTCRRKCKSM